MLTTSGRTPKLVLGAMLAGGIVGCCGQTRQCATHDPCTADCVAMTDTPCVPSGHQLPSSQYSPQSDGTGMPAHRQPMEPTAPEPLNGSQYPDLAPPPPAEVERPAASDDVPPPPPLPGHAKSRLRPGTGRGVASREPSRPRGLLYRFTGAPNLFSTSSPPPVEPIARHADQRPLPSSASGQVAFQSPSQMRSHQTVSASVVQPVTLMPPEPVFEEGEPGPLPAPGRIPVEHTFGHVLP
ncbi:MAG: hypothetical protein ACF8PG_13420 [Maioricimonas sp. JB045]